MPAGYLEAGELPKLDRALGRPCGAHAAGACAANLNAYLEAGRGGKVTRRRWGRRVTSRYRGLTYSDPFGLCPDSVVKENGRCPGDLSKDQWNKVERATTYMDASASARTMRQLFSGHIKAGYVEDGRGEVKAADVKTVIISTSSSLGKSVFDLAPSELARTLMHEGWHTVQLAGMKPKDAAAIMNDPVKKIQLELQAEAYARNHFKTP
jgi:hypothetical protein